MCAQIFWIKKKSWICHWNIAKFCESENAIKFSQDSVERESAVKFSKNSVEVECVLKFFFFF